MPKPETGDKPEKGKARKAIGEIAVRAFKVLAVNELADAIRETIAWLTN
ncbi:hypothetical protein [Corynebacterium diphtheriae]|nr:hypothetical protein [Corynebacterium diphtheriae]CAB0542807.1 hypothetical protein CIP107522_00696 [Corynebacterium diphtheriae]